MASSATREHLRLYEATASVSPQGDADDHGWQFVDGQPVREAAAQKRTIGSSLARGSGIVNLAPIGLCPAYSPLQTSAKVLDGGEPLFAFVVFLP